MPRARSLRVLALPLLLMTSATWAQNRLTPYPVSSPPRFDAAIDQGTRTDTGAPEPSSWRRAAEFGQFSIEFLSDRLTAYPYPHMTVVEGFVGGGMEYP